MKMKKCQDTQVITKILSLEAALAEEVQVEEAALVERKIPIRRNKSPKFQSQLVILL